MGLGGSHVWEAVNDWRFKLSAGEKSNKQYIQKELQAEDWEDRRTVEAH